MSTVAQPAVTGSGPTEDRPEFGVISVHDVPISQVAHWRDGDLYVFRSTEFDVIAADEDLQKAIVVFVDNASDYADMVSELTASELTQHEAEVAMLILRRLSEAYKQGAEMFRARARHHSRVVRLLRGRGHDAPRTWYRKSSLPTSSRQLRA